MADFERLNRETQAYRNTCVDRFNPSTRSNYSATFSSACGSRQSGFSYSPDRSRDIDRFNPSTRGNYSKRFPAADLFG
jgi:hypothetical protein